MRKYRKFDEGGPTYGEDERPAPTGMSEAAELMPEKPKGFKDAFREARSAGDKTFTWQGKKYTTEMAGSKTAPPSGTPGGAYRGQRAEAPAPKAASFDIPKGKESAPESTGEDTSGPSNLDRILLGIPVAGAGIAGAAKLAQMRKAKQAADTAKTAREAASKFASPQARQVTSDTGRKFGPKAEMEAAESTMRGAVGRRDIQAKRAAAESARGRAETMERNKPVLQATPKKASPRSRTRDEDVDYELRAKGGRIGYAKGGSVRGGGCEIRGKTRGVMR